MSGFVLNKKVGDYGGWNHRQAYIRIYDPRDFEFEISIENLLYILENTNSIKGKGLEGEFIYGWDGKELVLLPLESPDYKTISEYNNILYNNKFVKAKELLVGATYLTKDNKKLIFMGKFDYYDWVDCLCEKQYFFAEEVEKYDWIEGEEVRIGTSYDFICWQSINKKLINIYSSDCIENYSDIFSLLEKNKHYSPRDDSKDEYIMYSYDEFVKYVEESRWYVYCFSQSDNGDHYSCQFQKLDNGLLSYSSLECERKLKYEEYEREIGYGYMKRTETYKRFIPISIEELYERMKPCYLNKYLKNGNLYERIHG